MSQQTPAHRNTFTFPAPRVFIFLMAIICSLTSASILSFLTTHLTLENYWLIECRESLIRLFTVDGEANIPSWYSSSALLMASALLVVVIYFKAKSEDSYLLHWKILAFTFLYLSLDEAAVIHEMLNKPLRSAFDTDGLLYYPWVIAAGAFLLILLFAYARFLLELPSKTRWLFVASGVIFVSGAIGAEFISSYNQTVDGMNSLSYQIPMNMEEFLEMTGVALFIYALMLYLNEHVIADAGGVKLPAHENRSSTNHPN